jgi:hypothetical protein
MPGLKEFSLGRTIVILLLMAGSFAIGYQYSEQSEIETSNLSEKSSAVSAEVESTTLYSTKKQEGSTSEKKPEDKPNDPNKIIFLDADYSTGEALTKLKNFYYEKSDQFWAKVVDTRYTRLKEKEWESEKDRAYSKIKEALEISIYWLGEINFEIGGKYYPMTYFLHFYDSASYGNDMDLETLKDPQNICWSISIFFTGKPASGSAGDGGCFGEYSFSRKNDIYYSVLQIYDKEAEKDFTYLAYTLPMNSRKTAPSEIFDSKLNKWKAIGQLHWQDLTKQKFEDLRKSMWEN